MSFGNSPELGIPHGRFHFVHQLPNGERVAFVHRFGRWFVDFIRSSHGCRYADCAPVCHEEVRKYLIKMHDAGHFSDNPHMREAYKAVCNEPEPPGFANTLQTLGIESDLGN